MAAAGRPAVPHSGRGCWALMVSMDAGRGFLMAKRRRPGDPCERRRYSTCILTSIASLSDCDCSVRVASGARCDAPCPLQPKEEYRADLQGPRRRRAVPAERRVPDQPLQQPAGLRRRLARPGRGGAGRGGQARRGGGAAAQPHRRRGRLHAPRRRQRHHARRDSRRPTSNTPTAAGWAFRRRPNSAARACRKR